MAFITFSIYNTDNLVKSPNPVTPAKAGVQKLLKLLDSGLRRNDDLREIQTFYETINIDELVKSHFAAWIPAFAGMTAIVSDRY